MRMSTMMKTAATIVTLLLALLCASPLSAQDETGGTSGAEFLLYPPASRVDAMGGVLDGQGNALEGIFLNPAVLMLEPMLQLQVNINPLPNDVMHNQVAFGLPLFGGMAGFSAQLLNVGEFTSIDSGGTAGATFSVYDAALAAGYARTVWNNLAVGLSAKGVYRTLGDYTALAFGTDLGAAWWFETPHMGQRPKAPTREQLERELAGENRGIDAEKEKRTKAAAGEVPGLRAEVGKLEASLASAREKTAAAAPEKQEPLKAKEAELEAALAGRRAALADAEAGARDALAAIDAWELDQRASAQARFEQKLANLGAVETERLRLFAVIDDPGVDLEDETIDRNIGDSIRKTRQFLADRTAALAETEAGYRAKREARIEGLRQEIATYEGQIESEAGPALNRLGAEIESLKAQIAEAEGAEAPDKERIKELKATQAAKEKEYSGLQADPWIKRLAGRIAEKKKEIAAVEADIAANAGRTAKEAEELAVRTEKDVEKFEALRDTLKKELKRAKLKRELDLIDARRDKSAEKAQREYKAKEKKLYLQLLAAMYGNEEKLFRVRLDSVKADSETRRFDFDTEQQKSRETAENDFAFQERYLGQKINEQKAAQKSGGGDAGELQRVTEELAGRQEAYKQTLAGLIQQQKTFTQDEGDRLNDESAAILEERRKVRLIYLQTDKPYLNTSVVMGLRNLGSNVTFEQEGYPMPLTFTTAVGYTFLHTDLHSARLSAQANLPLYGESSFEDLSVGVGAEYGFADLAFLRAGYTFGAEDRSFSVGFGVRLGLGFTHYAVDYTFRPLPDYGFLHSFGVSIAF